MTNIKCPQGDGVCTYPDSTLIAVGNQLSVVSGSAVPQIFPRLSFDVAKETRVLDDEGGYDSVVNLVLSAFRVSESESVVVQNVMGAEEATTRVNIIESQLPLSTGVIVTCSCGHTWAIERS